MVSQHGLGFWFALRLIEEGHQVELWLTKRGAWENALRGLIPEPYLRRPPTSVLEQADLILFDQNGQGKLAEELRKYAPVLGDGMLASKIEDDRLYGIQTMEAAGIEVPFYEVFQSPDEARSFLKERPARYVYKPSSPPGEEQPSATTYVSDSCEDMMACLDKLFQDTKQQPFLLQEVVKGEEISVEGWADGSNFHLLGLTIETKKLMNDNLGPNTGASGTLESIFNNMPKLYSRGLGRMIEWVRANNYRGMLDLNTIVNESHCYGLEWTARFGYDCCATRFALLEDDLGRFLHQLATAPEGGMTLDLKLKADWAASARYSIPPYPMEIEGMHPDGVPITGIPLEDAWRDFYLYDAKIEGEKLVTAGVFGHVCSPIGTGHTAKGAWSSLERRIENLKIPDMQARTDLEEATLKRLDKIREWGWLT